MTHEDLIKLIEMLEKLEEYLEEYFPDALGADGIKKYGGDQ